MEAPESTGRNFWWAVTDALTGGWEVEYVITIICLMVKSILTIWSFLETTEKDLKVINVLS